MQGPILCVLLSEVGFLSRFQGISGVSTDSSSTLLWQRGGIVVAQPWHYTILHQDVEGCKTFHWPQASKTGWQRRL